MNGAWAINYMPNIIKQNKSEEKSSLYIYKSSTHHAVGMGEIDLVLTAIFTREWIKDQNRHRVKILDQISEWCLSLISRCSTLEYLSIWLGQVKRFFINCKFMTWCISCLKNILIAILHFKMIIQRISNR